jgi:hypothetical protein
MRIMTTVSFAFRENTHVFSDQFAKQAEKQKPNKTFGFFLNWTSSNLTCGKWFIGTLLKHQSLKASQILMNRIFITKKCIPE